MLAKLFSCFGTKASLRVSHEVCNCFSALLWVARPPFPSSTSCWVQGSSHLNISAAQEESGASSPLQVILIPATHTKEKGLCLVMQPTRRQLRLVFLKVCAHLNNCRALLDRISEFKCHYNSPHHVCVSLSLHNLRKRCLAVCLNPSHEMCSHECNNVANHQLLALLRELGALVHIGSFRRLTYIDARIWHTSNSILHFLSCQQ